MTYYVFDGSFDGLLTSISRSLERNDIEGIIDESYDRENLFADYINISTDKKNAERLFARIENIFPSSSLHHIMCAYLSDVKGSYDSIRRYIGFGLSAGKKTDMHLSQSEVYELHRLSLKVRTECHRLLGLVRFELVEDGLYYSKISPDHNIISMIAPHFRRRMGIERWMIHDSNRDLAAINTSAGLKYSNIAIEKTPELHEDELEYRSMWKSYFKKIAITERKNPRLQRQFMPQRYWKNLTEFQ